MATADKLARLYMFSGVPRARLDAFADKLRSVEVNAGQRLFSQGEVADAAWLLVEGRLVVTVQADAESRTIGDVRPGELLGETALYLPGGRRSATVTASTASTALRLDPAGLDAMADNPAVVALERQLLGVMSRRLRSTNLAIQRAWKDEQATAPGEPQGAGFSARLRQLFGGVLSSGTRPGDRR